MVLCAARSTVVPDEGRELGVGYVGMHGYTALWPAGIYSYHINDRTSRLQSACRPRSIYSIQLQPHPDHMPDLGMLQLSRLQRSRRA